MSSIEPHHLPLYRRLWIAIAAVDGLRVDNQAALDALVGAATIACKVLERLDECAAKNDPMGRRVREILDQLDPRPESPGWHKYWRDEQ